MKKITLCIVVLFCVSRGFTQSSTAGRSEEFSIGTTDMFVLIVPFESKMFQSTIGKELQENSGLSYQELKTKFRTALDREIFLALRSYYTPFSFFALPPEKQQLELDYVYNGLHYEYVLLPIKVEEKRLKKLFSKFSKKEKEENYIQAGMQNGQIVSQVDDREKYMKTTFLNSDLRSSIQKKYPAYNYLFISQLDIKHAIASESLGAFSPQEREIKVHYTIMSALGEQLSGGAIKSYFFVNENEMDTILKVQFPSVAQQIVKELVEVNQAD
jgi:hypothetical protein